MTTKILWSVSAAAARMTCSSSRRVMTDLHQGSALAIVENRGERMAMAQHGTCVVVGHDDLPRLADRHIEKLSPALDVPAAAGTASLPFGDELEDSEAQVGSIRELSER